ncbi:MAG: hypothetical protein U1E77_08415 [Inhella sp.]
MRRLFFACGTALLLCALQARAHVVQRYSISGVAEGGGLSLRSDGRFEFGMSYGAIDLRAQGHWRRRGQTLELLSDPPAQPGFSISSQAEQDLSAREGDPAIVLRVKVQTSRQEIVWSNIKVTARFSNGEERSGLTGRGGLLGFLWRDEPVWREARVERIQLHYEREDIRSGWLAVKPSAKHVEVEFEPGRLAPVAFKRVILKEEEQGSRLTVKEGDLSSALVFVRR